MSVTTLTRKHKAVALVPLAVLSAAWTASIAGVGSATASGNAAAADHSSLPDGTAVPSQAIEAPASVPVPGVIAPSVPNGSADSIVSGASASGIPSPALSAYQRGAQIIDAADKACNVPWELIAAIGRVESDHGRYGGNTLSADGVSKPGIYGPQLNGKNNTQAIQDTDAGQLDKDPVYDRAVGPMQFIPSTWSVVKVDADADGKRNPQDIDDAALATGVYLCSGSENLASHQGQEAAVFRYNHSQSYVDLVLNLMKAYAKGDYTAVPSGTYAGTLFSPSSTTAMNTAHHKAKKNKASGGSSHATTPGSTTPGSTTNPGTTPGTGGGSGGGGGKTTDPTSPIKEAGEDAGKAVGGAVDKVTKPVVDTVASVGEALGLCNAKLGPLARLPLVSSIANKCASRIVGMETPEAKSSLSGILSGLLKPLGLHL